MVGTSNQSVLEMSVDIWLQLDPDDLHITVYPQLLSHGNPLARKNIAMV